VFLTRRPSHCQHLCSFNSGEHKQQSRGAEFYDDKEGSDKQSKGGIGAYDGTTNTLYKSRRYVLYRSQYLLGSITK